MAIPAVKKDMPTWVLLLIADDAYAARAFDTIMEARTRGGWKDDIVLMTTPAVMERETYRSGAYGVKMIPQHEIRCSFWNDLPEECEFRSYALSRPNLYAKFGMMSTAMKAWDRVLYMDAGTRIFGSLSRLTAAAESGFLYAHSDAYPSYVWKLTGQFDLNLLDKTSRKVFLETFDTDRDYFQSTVMLFSTSIIEESTLDELIDLSRQWPISRRGDQGVFNLYFNCIKGIWKPLPVRDGAGFLYDFMEREGHSRHEYVALKYPR